MRELHGHEVALLDFGENLCEALHAVEPAGGKARFGVVRDGKAGFEKSRGHLAPARPRCHNLVDHGGVAAEPERGHVVVSLDFDSCDGGRLAADDEGEFFVPGAVILFAVFDAHGHRAVHASCFHTPERNGLPAEHAAGEGDAVEHELAVFGPYGGFAFVFAVTENERHLVIALRERHRENHVALRRQEIRGEVVVPQAVYRRNRPAFEAVALRVAVLGVGLDLRVARGNRALAKVELVVFGGVCHRECGQKRCDSHHRGCFDKGVVALDFSFVIHNNIPFTRVCACTIKCTIKFLEKQEKFQFFCKIR